MPTAQDRPETLTTGQVETLETVSDNGEIESVETVTKIVKRGRGAAPTVNYKSFFPTEKDCDENSPCNSDGKIAEQYRTYKIEILPPIDANKNVLPNEDIYIDKNTVTFVAARNADQACAFFSETLRISAGVASTKSGGRKKRIELMMLQFLVRMHTLNLPKDQIEAFYTADGGKCEHYRTIDLSKIKDGVENAEQNEIFCNELAEIHCPVKA